MNVAVALVTVALLAAVITLISHPLRVHRRDSALQSAELAELEAARDAKYREIRDTELDYATGKLSPEDYAAVNGTLRAEAVEILRRLDELGELDTDGGAES
jgi:CRP-like cAMP-binding protein